jgi:hypothetical protein
MKSDKEINDILDKYLVKQPKFDVQQEILKILNSYLSMATKFEPQNENDIKLKNDRLEEIMEEIKYFSSIKLSKKEAIEYLEKLVS